MIGMISRRFFHASKVNLATARSSYLGKLRKSTGYSMLNCKKALDLFPDDVSKAEEWLHAQAKQQGWSKLAKIQGRSATQGLVGVFTKDRTGVMVEINCETDFVAKNVEFHQLVENVLSCCMNQLPSSSGAEVTKTLLEEPQLIDLQLQDGSIRELVNAAIAKFNEKTVVKRAICVQVPEDLNLSSLSHPSTACPNLHGASVGKYGTLLAYRQNSANSDESLVQSLCQHVIGMNPVSVGELTEQDILDFNKKQDDDPVSEAEAVTEDPIPEAKVPESKIVESSAQSLENDQSSKEEENAEGGEVEDSEEQESVVRDVKEVEETRLLFQTFLLDANVTVGETVYKNDLEIVDFERFECGENRNIDSGEMREVESAAL